MQDFDRLAKQLQPYYSRFDVANRLLFTGHSHQAWPDAAFSGVEEYMNLVARQVGNKWTHAFEKTDVLRQYLRRFYDDPSGNYCREQNTHILLAAWLSSLDLKTKPKIITTTGEFHSMHRQLRRLEEKGLHIVYLPHQHDGQLLEAIKKETDEKTAAVMLSRVYFETSEINTSLSAIAKHTKKAGIPLLVDDYHGTNVAPLSFKQEHLGHIYMLVGGYKYLQWGEGNCFLRYPADCPLRPAITGWFSAFGQLDHKRNNEPVAFDDGEQKFATATYDPTSQYRAAAVVHFFDTHGLTPDVLKKQYSGQVQYLRHLFDDANLDRSEICHANTRSIEETGGFLALRSKNARLIRQKLLEKGIHTDARGDILRFGPAPYITSRQCELAIEALRKTIKQK